jgi:hypothetical protein
VDLFLSELTFETRTAIRKLHGVCKVATRDDTAVMENVVAWHSRGKNGWQHRTAGTLAEASTAVFFVVTIPLIPPTMSSDTRKRDIEAFGEKTAGLDLSF